MRHNTIRCIDYLVGRPLCGMLTMHRRLLKNRDALQALPPRSIVFLKLIEQGATVSAIPALRRGIEMCGADNCYFFVFDTNRAIIDLLGLFPAENILVVRHDTFAHFCVDVLRALRRLRAARVEAAVDMEFFSRASALLAYLTGATRRAGLHRFEMEAPYRGDLMTHRIQYNPRLHVSDFYLGLVEALTLDPADAPMPKRQVRAEQDMRNVFVPCPEEIEALRERILALFDSRALPSPLILLNPNAHDSLAQRRWPSERFIALGREILSQWPEAGVLITGAPSEAPGAAQICSEIASPRARSIAGATTLRELVTLYTLAQALVTNDSGPGHFASLTSVTNIVLFGPETPAVFAPRGANSHIIYENLACSPCVSPLNHRFSPCRNNRCMTQISVAQVMSRLIRALDAPAA